MTTQHESDPAAAEETLEIVGGDVIAALAHAAHVNNVIININIMPNSESIEEDNT